MVMGLGREPSDREGDYLTPYARSERSAQMKVHVYPRVEGKSTAMVIPGKAAHLPPIVVSSSDREAFKAELAAVIDAHSPEAVQPNIPF